MLREGKPLGGRQGGDRGAQPGLLSAARPESVATSASSLLRGASTQARTFSPAFHLITSGHLLQDTRPRTHLRGHPPTVLSTCCSFPSWCQTSLVACSLLCIQEVFCCLLFWTLGILQWERRGASATLSGFRDKLSPQRDNLRCTSSTVSLPLVDPPRRKSSMKAAMECPGTADLRSSTADVWCVREVDQVLTVPMPG